MVEDFGLVKTQFAEYLPIDVERLPSGDYGTNRLILSLSTLAFNILRHIGQTARQVEVESGERRPERIRLRTVMLNLMYIAACMSRFSPCCIAFISCASFLLCKPELYTRKKPRQHAFICYCWIKLQKSEGGGICCK